MEPDPPPPPPLPPDRNLLPFLNGLFLIGGLLGSALCLAEYGGTTAGLAVGVAAILATLFQCAAVQSLVETRKELYAARLENAHLLAGAVESRERDRRHGECLDWIVQRLAPGDAPPPVSPPG